MVLWSITSNYCVTKYFKKLIVFYFLIIFAFAEFEKDLQLKLILAEPGDTIKLDAGFFPILGTLSMEGKQNIVIKGSGTSSTILNFSNQVEWAQGLSITNCNNITLEDFTVEEGQQSHRDYFLNMKKKTKLLLGYLKLQLLQVEALVEGSIILYQLTQKNQ